MENKYSFTEITKVLKSGGTILYPTDTIWGIGCDATNAKAVEKIYRIKVRDVGKSLIILADSIETLKKYVEEVPDNAIEMIQSYSDPLTIIYPKAKNLPKNVIANDGSIAIRIPNDDFCNQLIRDFGKPITSTSANISGDPSPLTYSQISDKIIGMVDHVVTIKQQSLRLPKPSAIIKVDIKGNIYIIRS